MKNIRLSIPAAVVYLTTGDLALAEHIDGHEVDFRIFRAVQCCNGARPQQIEIPNGTDDSELRRLATAALHRTPVDLYEVNLKWLTDLWRSGLPSEGRRCDSYSVVSVVPETGRNVLFFRRCDALEYGTNKVIWRDVTFPSKALLATRARRGQDNIDQIDSRAPISGIRTNKAANAEAACKAWFERVKEQIERPPSRDKAFELAREAVSKEGELSRKAFDRVWHQCAPADWHRPGRRPASRNRGP